MKKILSLLILSVMVLSVGLVSAASISTDKNDYQPGEIVLISGEDFNVDSPLIVTVTRPDSAIESCDESSCDSTFLDGLLESDSDGAFSDYQYDLNGIEGEYLIEISDGENTAEITFTDFAIEIDSPNGGETWSGTNNIEWHYYWNFMGPFDYKIYYKAGNCDGAISSWTQIDGTQSCGIYDCTYSWDTSTVSNGDYCIGIRKTSGIYLEDKSDDVFNVFNDNEAPEVTDIQHTPEYPTCSDNIEICANVTDDSDIDSVLLNLHNGDSFTLTMFLDGDRYCRTVSAETLLAEDEMTITYSIYAEDEHGNNQTTQDYEFTFDCLAPTAGFYCEPLSGNEDLEVNCYSESWDTVDSDLDYYWIFVGGIPSSSTDEDPEDIVYYNDGLYTVSLTVTDDAGHSDTKTEIAYINVSDVGPEASFNEDMHQFGESQTVSFTDTSESHDPILSWLWDFGDGETSTEQNSSHTYADNGTYIVTLTICDEDNDCDEATDTKYVSNEAPNPNAGEYECDEGETIILTATFVDVAGDGPWIIEWDFDGDDVYDDASGASVSYTCGNGDDYLDDTVAVKVTDKDEDSGYDDAEINISNIAPIANADGDYVGVIDGGVELTGSATDPIETSFTYRWDCDYDGMTFDSEKTGQNPICIYSEKGTYTVAVIANDGEDDSEIATAQVIIHEYKIDLYLGWNLISIPLVPEGDDVSISNVFGLDVSSKAEKIWSYKEGKWTYNAPLTSGEWSTASKRLKEIVPGYGYYIFMNNETTSYQDGEKYYGVDYAYGENPDIPMPPQVVLITGWNLIGHYGMNDVDKVEEVQDLSGGILTDLADINMLNKNALPVSSLVPTIGYWAFITGQNELLYAPSEADYATLI